jgi:hypothetical protein
MDPITVNEDEKNWLLDFGPICLSGVCLTHAIAVKPVRTGCRSTQYDKIFASGVCQKISFGLIDDRYIRVSKLSLASETDRVTQQ